MAQVHFGSDLLQYTGGVESMTIDASRVLELKRTLGSRFPALTARIEHMAIAIDGEIFNDADYRDLAADAEIHFVPRTVGG